MSVCRTSHAFQWCVRFWWLNDPNKPLPMSITQSLCNAVFPKIPPEMRASALFQHTWFRYVNNIAMHKKNEMRAEQWCLISCPRLCMFTWPWKSYGILCACDKELHERRLFIWAARKEIVRSGFLALFCICFACFSSIWTIFLCLWPYSSKLMTSKIHKRTTVATDLSINWKSLIKLY